jgi:hypothetical protein
MQFFKRLFTRPIPPRQRVSFAAYNDGRLVVTLETFSERMRELAADPDDHHAGWSWTSSITLARGLEPYGNGKKASASKTYDWCVRHAQIGGAR